MQDLKISVIQTILHWENIEKNIKHFESKISLINGVDLIILPEMFTTGFSMKPENFAKESYETALLNLKKWAQEKNCCIVGSVMVEENEKFYNRLIFLFPDGSFKTYDKRHLFTMGEENKHYTKGNERLVLKYKNWTICPLICYDLRFPVFSRNTEEIDLYLYVANWPQAREYAWKQLLITRAIENQSYVVACNRIGEDINHITHSGHSGLINPKGEPRWIEDEKTETFTISKKDLLEFRTQFPVLKDADDFELK